MTSTSFHSPQPGCRELFLNNHEPDRPAAQRDEAVQDPLSYAHAAETQRMKAFAGQSKFQAPVSDDFSRGMLEFGQAQGHNPKSPRNAGMINSLTAWLRRQRLG